jgi:AcrR family transcriptional regulator
MLTLSRSLRLFYARCMSESSYHHGHLREALIDEAVSAVRSDGPSGLGIRSLARRIGVSHNAAYRHFEDRDELVTAVADQVMEQLLAAMRARFDEVHEPDPTLRARRRLAEAGRAYVEYAVSEAELFRLAFGSMAVAIAESWSPETGPLHLLGQVLDELVEVGFLDPEARIDAELTCWSAVHGFSILCIDGPLRGATFAERSAALDRVLVSIDRSYGASTGAPTKPEDIRS